MKSLYYLLLLTIFTACSKSESEKEQPKNPSFEGYVRVSTIVKPYSYTYTPGEKAKIQLIVIFDRQVDQKASRIVKLEASNTGEKFRDDNINLLSSKSYTTHTFETSALNLGKNTFNYTLIYEDGYKQKGQFDLLAIKDKTLDTWWDEMTFEHLDTTRTPTLIVHASTDIHDIASHIVSKYGDKLPDLIQINGIYGTITAHFDAAKKIQMLTVGNARIVSDETASLDIVKNDILAAFPDCQVTSMEPYQRYLLTSPKYTFEITQNTYLTTVIKRR
jgi:hypothetical protein